MKRAVTALIVSVIVAGAAHSQFTNEKEMLLGQKMAAELDSREKIIADGDVLGFVEGVVKRLSRNESLRLPLKLRVIDHPEIVASALPGGLVVLSSGAILQSESEAELAGLLSHAMGHVQARQFHKVATSAGTPEIFRSCTRAADGAGGGILMPLAMQAQAELFESQADLLGLGYMANGGYDPVALVSFFNHLPGTSRLNESVNSRAIALSNNVPSAILNTSAFDRIKARLTPPGASQRPVPTLYR